MASYRKPRGTYTRPTGDWFYQKLGTAGWAAGTSTGNFGNATVGFLNNDTLGRKLHIYGLSFEFSGGNNVMISLINGPVGTHRMDAVSIDPTGPAMPGAVYSQEFGSIALPVFAGIPPGFVTAAGLTAGQWYQFATHPIFVLPFGWQLQGVGDYASSQYSMGVWFIPFGAD